MTLHPPYPAAIVVPVLEQRQDWLEQCLTSALEQTVACEVVVVHAPRTSPASRARLERLACDHPNLAVLCEAPPGGFAAAINTGLRHACAPRVGLLLSDDWLEPTAASECLAVDADIVSSGTVVYAADGLREITRRSSCRREFEARPTLEAKAAYLEHFLLFRRERVLAVGGVDERVGDTGPDDYDLPWTLLERGASVGLVPKALYNYRDHEESRLSLRSRGDQVRDVGRILDKHGISGAERRRIVADHARWFGRTIESVLAADARGRRR